MQQEPLDQHLFVIMGGTGDLAQRKLIPALFRVARERNNLETFRVLGVAPHDELDDESYRSFLVEQLEEHSTLFEEADRNDVRDWLHARFHYQSIGDGSPSEYSRLNERINSLEQETGLPGNRVYYLALPHHVFQTAITGLGEAKLDEGPGWTRLVIEKPFGEDTSSAKVLNEHVHKYFEEKQIYRIDHYLGKETVQNLMIFRFANPIFETQWNRERIDSVQVTVAEGLGVGERAGYYDNAGAVRDMMQNHLTQIFSLVAMEEPARFEPEEAAMKK